MAKVTIIIEDLPNGKVRTTSTPSFEIMAKMAKAEALTSAHGYAIRALRSVQEDSKKAGHLIVPIPKLKPGYN